MSGFQREIVVRLATVLADASPVPVNPLIVFAATGLIAAIGLMSPSIVSAVAQAALRWHVRLGGAVRKARSLPPPGNAVGRWDTARGSANGRRGAGGSHFPI